MAIQSTAEDAFRAPALVAAMLLLFTMPMLAAERYGSQKRDLDDANAKDAVLMGLAQSIALIPGVSRSGITISAAMFDGFKREQAAVFTFLLARRSPPPPASSRSSTSPAATRRAGRRSGVIAAGW